MISHWYNAIVQASMLDIEPAPPPAGSPPTLADATVAQRFFGQSGVETYNVSACFAGTGITYTLISAPTGVTIHPTTAVISIDTDAIHAAKTGYYRKSILIHAENVDGMVETTFNLTVCTIHWVSLNGVNNATATFDCTAYTSINRRVWILNFSGFNVSLTIDSVAATSLIGHNVQLVGVDASRIYTSTTADDIVNLAWSGSLSNSLTVCFVTYGYDATPADYLYAQDSGGDADASVLGDIDIPVGGAVALIARNWETITTPAAGMQTATGNNFCVAGCIIVEAGDATYDLQVDTDTATANKVMMAFSLTPLAA